MAPILQRYLCQTLSLRFCCSGSEWWHWLTQSAPMHHRYCLVNHGLYFGGREFLPELMSHIFIFQWQPQRPLVMALTALTWHLYITSTAFKKWTMDLEVVSKKYMPEWNPQTCYNSNSLIDCLSTVVDAFYQGRISRKSPGSMVFFYEILWCTFTKDTERRLKIESPIKGT